MGWQSYETGILLQALHTGQQVLVRNVKLNDDFGWQEGKPGLIIELSAQSCSRGEGRMIV